MLVLDPTVTSDHPETLKLLHQHGRGLKPFSVILAFDLSSLNTRLALGLVSEIGGGTSHIGKAHALSEALWLRSMILQAPRCLNMQLAIQLVH